MRKMTFIKRKLLDNLRIHLSKNEITVIIGARQTGKTTLMKILERELKEKGEMTLYINLDVEDDVGYLKSQRTLLRKLDLEFGNRKGYVFIDEIQRKENAGVFLKGVYDLELPHKFIVSGSGSFELRENIQESLAGRKRVFELDTVSFEEFVDFKTDYKYEGKLHEFFKVEPAATLLFIEEYLQFGGYPRVATEKSQLEKLENIREIYRSYVEKDITYLLRVAKVHQFSFLVKMLAILEGRLLNLSKLSKDVGVSEKTIREYLWYLEKTYILDTVTPFHTNKVKELAKMPICYFRDIGMRNYAAGEFGRLSDMSFPFQNFVYIQLLELSRELDFTIHFWRSKDGAEVDFVLKRGETLVPIEVKWQDMKDVEIPRSLRSFMKRYEPETALVVNRSFHHATKIYKTSVHILPFYRLQTFIRETFA